MLAIKSKMTAKVESCLDNSFSSAHLICARNLLKAYGSIFYMPTSAFFTIQWRILIHH